MNFLIFLIQNHPYMTGTVAGLIFSAIVTSLPTPSKGDGKGYVFFFNFMHTVALALPRIPGFRSFVGLQQNPTTLEGIKAENSAQKADPSVQGIVQKPPEGKP